MFRLSICLYHLFSWYIWKPERTSDLRNWSYGIVRATMWETGTQRGSSARATSGQVPTNLSDPNITAHLNYFAVFPYHLFKNKKSRRASGTDLPISQSSHFLCEASPYFLIVPPRTSLSPLRIQLFEGKRLFFFKQALLGLENCYPQISPTTS